MITNYGIAYVQILVSYSLCIDVIDSNLPLRYRSLHQLQSLPTHLHIISIRA